MNGSSDRDPLDDDSSPFDAERAVYRADRSASDQPDGGVTTRRNGESPLRTVGTATGLGIAGIVVLAVVSAVVGFLGATAGLALGTVFVVSVALGQYLGFIGLGLTYLRSRGFDWSGIRSYLGIRLPSLREVGVIVAGYLAIIGALVAVLVAALQFLPQPAENQGAQMFASNPELIPVGIVVMFLVVGPSEELLYRGIVQNRLRERLSAVPAVAIAGTIFAVVHVVALAGSPSSVAVTVLVLLVPGLVLGIVYEYTGNLVVPWLLHSTHNSVLLTVLLFADQMNAPSAVLAALAAFP